MNENSLATLKYMCIHLFIFLFKNIFVNWLLKYSKKDIINKKQNDIELLEQKRDNLKEKIREVSSVNEYVKFAKMERQINNLNDEIHRLKTLKVNSNINDNMSSNMNIVQKIIISILNSMFFKFFMFFINIIEYFIFRNKYLEIDYQEKKNNIIVNYFYDESKNSDYSLISISRILLCETIVLNSLLDLSKNYK